MMVGRPDFAVYGVMDMSFLNLEILVLASGSPRRRELLGLAGVPIEVVCKSIDESVLPGESPESLVIRLSAAKATAVALDRPQRWVLGADTVVVLEGEIFGKPRDDDDAVRMLMALQGREHVVIGGFSFVQSVSNRTISRVCSTAVRMARVSKDRILEYVAGGEPRDKAGAYAIQGGALPFIEEINGSYSNVVGLPLAQVVAIWETLRSEGTGAGSGDGV